ncbi:MAG: glycosyltransferase [Deltaproteobacteria bacterium]|nr:glycosyltransferase [Deltaproteobacteria bacterium]
MRILQLCPKVPWPPDDGGRVAMRVLALSLQRAGAEVRTLSLNPLKHRVDPASLPDEARTLRLEAVDVDTSVTVGGALKSLLARSSYNVGRFYSEPFERRLREIVREEPPDIVLLESLYMVPYVPALRAATPAPLVLRSLNVEHEIGQGLARGARGLVRRLYVTPLARRLREYEVSTLNEVDAIVTVTPEDAEAYRDLGATRPLHVSPVGIDTAVFPDRSGHGDPRTLIFLGSLDWRPNLEAVEWFLESVWPLVRRAVPGARFHVAGSNPPAGLSGRRRDDDVSFLGRAPDVREFLSSGGAMVVPLHSGSGIRVKILEAMALGVPVVSTPLGAAGIGARDGEEILLAESPESLAEACADLLSNRDRALAIGRAGRRRIHADFGADGIGRSLLTFLTDRTVPQLAL